MVGTQIEVEAEVPVVAELEVEILTEAEMVRQWATKEIEQKAATMASVMLSL